MLTCDEIRPLLHAYEDGELDVPHVLEIDRHLADCTACARGLEQIQALRATLRQESLYAHAPRELKERVRRAVRQASGNPRRRLWRSLAWASAVAALLAIAIIGRTLLLEIPRRSASDVVAQRLFDSHRGSLILAGHQVDVESSDQHTVKPWFEGRLNFSPTVPDLSGQGFELRGGRLDYMDNHPIAVLVYQRRKHLINVFIWQGERDHAPADATRDGYHLLGWKSGDLDYAAVSNLNEAELREFVQHLQKATTPAKPESRQ